MRTGALDVAVGEKAIGLGIEELLRGALVDEALLELLQEHLLRDPGVMIGSGRGVEIPLQTDLVPLPHELAVVAINDVLRGHALGVGANRDRRAVHVGATHHQHLVADHSLMTGEDISRQIAPAR